VSPDSGGDNFGLGDGGSRGLRPASHNDVTTQADGSLSVLSAVHNRASTTGRKADEWFPSVQARLQRSRGAMEAHQTSDLRVAGSSPAGIVFKRVFSKKKGHVYSKILRCAISCFAPAGEL
jgi:hypothetical protein